MIFRQFRNWILSWTYSSLWFVIVMERPRAGVKESLACRENHRNIGLLLLCFCAKCQCFLVSSWNAGPAHYRIPVVPCYVPFQGCTEELIPLDRLSLACAQTSLLCTPIDGSLWREWSVPTLGLGASGFHQTSQKPLQPICHPRLFPASSSLRSCWCITSPKPENHWKKNSL